METNMTFNPAVTATSTFNAKSGNVIDNSGMAMKATQFQDANGNILVNPTVANTFSATQSFAAGSYLKESALGNVAAAGTTQGGATVLTTQVTEVATGTSNQGVLLPVSLPGYVFTVFNGTAATIKVYPSGSEIIDGGSASAAVTLTSAHRGATFYCFTAGAWISSLFGAATT